MALSAADRASFRPRTIRSLPLLRMRGGGAGPLLSPDGARGGEGRQNSMSLRKLARLSPPSLMLEAMAVLAR